MLGFRKFLLALTLIHVSLVHTVVAIDTDFDSDGLSDLVIASRNADANSTSWGYQSAASGFATGVSAGTLGTASDGLVPGYWTTANGAEIAVVNLNEDTSAITWTVLDLGNQQSSVQLGSEGDVLVSGGDYNGNGIFGAAAVSSNGSAQVLPDIFAGGTVSNISFSKKEVKNGLLFPLNRNGVNDDLASLRSSKKKKRYRNSLVVKDLSGAEAGIKFPNTKGEIIDAFGLSNGTTDNIVLVEKRKKKRRVYVFDLTGVELFKITVDAGTFLSGNFTLAGAEQIGVYSSGTLTVIDVASGGSAEFSGLPDTEVADFTTTTTLAGTSSGTIRDACPNGVRKVSAGFLWKPIADAGDQRFGLPVVLFSGSKKFNKKAVQIYARNGERICRFTLKVGEPGINCSADHYYSGWIGGCSLSGPQIARKAKKVAGSNKVYVQADGGTCFGPITPPSRTGGLAC